MLSNGESGLFASSPESGIPEVCRCGTLDGVITEPSESAEMGNSGLVEFRVIIFPSTFHCVKMKIVKTALGGRARTASRFPDHDSELGSQGRELVKS